MGQKKCSKPPTSWCGWWTRCPGVPWIPLVPPHQRDLQKKMRLVSPAPACRSTMDCRYLWEMDSQMDYLLISVESGPIPLSMRRKQSLKCVNECPLTSHHRSLCVWSHLDGRRITSYWCTNAFSASWQYLQDCTTRASDLRGRWDMTLDVTIFMRWILFPVVKVKEQQYHLVGGFNPSEEYYSNGIIVPNICASKLDLNVPFLPHLREPEIPVLGGPKKSGGDPQLSSIFSMAIFHDFWSLQRKWGTGTSGPSSCASTCTWKRRVTENSKRADFSQSWACLKRPWKHKSYGGVLNRGSQKL